ncbi:hypothetical protein FRC20_011421 [Serendipita sp. 405]|nr:hypothetical protein FRC20_011421 [Serendipita sp. 405]
MWLSCLALVLKLTAPATLKQMSALENQRVIHSPSIYRDGSVQNITNFTGNEDEQLPKFVNLRVETYAGLINAVVIVSILLFISIGYIIWLHCFQRRPTKRSTGLGMEKVSNKSYLKRPETPETFVNMGSVTTSLNKPTVSQESSTKSAPQYTGCIRSNSGEQKSPSSTPSTTASFSPVFPTNQMRIPERETAPSTPGMSVGDRLRTQKMLREITGTHLTSADCASLDPVVAATLGLGLRQEGNHSRSSLYTIAETVHERSTLSSPEPVSAPPSSRKFTHDAGP